MATELFIVVALPHSVADGRRLHVSLFVSPRLDPGRRRRQSSSDVHALPALGRNGRSRATRRSSCSTRSGRSRAAAPRPTLDPEVWDAVFPPDTPVRGPQDVDFSDRHWRTFRAGEVHDAAKLLHLVAMFSDPTSPPLPSVHPLTAAHGPAAASGARGPARVRRVARSPETRPS